MKFFFLFVSHMFLGTAFGQSYELGLAMHRFSKLGAVKNGSEFDSDYGIDMWVASSDFLPSNIKWLIGYRYSAGYIEKTLSYKYSTSIREGSDFRRQSIYINALTTFNPFHAFELNTGVEMVLRIDEKYKKQISKSLSNGLGFGVVVRIAYNIDIWPAYSISPIYTFHIGIVDEIIPLSQAISRHTFGLRLVKDLKRQNAAFE